MIVSKKFSLAKQELGLLSIPLLLTRLTGETRANGVPFVILDNVDGGFRHFRHQT
jgi:hypothetical protein